jgi:hypothetical protein
VLKAQETPEAEAEAYRSLGVGMKVPEVQEAEAAVPRASAACKGVPLTKWNFVSYYRARGHADQKKRPRVDFFFKAAFGWTN